MNQQNTIWVKLVGAPVVAFILFGAIGSFFWLDAIYGLFVVIGLPYFLIHSLAGV